VIFNLLANSAKFTPDGGAITLEAKEDGAGAIISVTDTGIGIEPEYQQKVFEPFYQMKSGLQDKTPGAGLGLSLCREIVEMHGGRIWVESGGINKGSRFSFVIPGRLVCPAAPSEASREQKVDWGSGGLKAESPEG
jgi:signal transduction histidine kinase